MSLRTDDLIAYRQQLSQLLDGRQQWRAPSAPQGHAQRWPLVAGVPRREADGTRSLSYALSLRTAPYLADHCIDGRPVLPMAAALEIMAQFVATAWPELQIVGLSELRVLSGVVLEGPEPLNLLLRATRAQQDTGSIAVELLDAHRLVVRYRAIVVVATGLTQSPDSPGRLPPPRFEPLRGGVAIDAVRLYGESLFHGECFRGLQQIDVLLAAGADARARPSSPQAFVGSAGAGAHWLFDPALVDLSPQLAWVWARQHRGMIALPSRIGRMTRYGEHPQAGPLTLHFRVRDSDESRLSYDAQLVDGQGRVCLLIEDGESTMSAALNRLAPDHPEFRRGLAEPVARAQLSSA